MVAKPTPIKDEEPRVTKMFVTPQMASEWLLRNPRNRKVRSDQVMKYAADIRAGNWQLNGESIIMANTGAIIDGQHRLLAIVEAQREIETFVASGVAESAFETIDQGKSRNAADVLSIHGYQNSESLASLARLWVLHTKGGNAYETGRTVPPTTQEIVGQVFERSAEFIDAINATRSHRKLFSGAAAFAFCYGLFGEIDQQDRDLFFDRLADGQLLEDGMPVYALRRALLEVRLRNRTMPRNHLIALLTKGWNKYRQHEVIKVLVYRAEEPWPMPV